jgi:hypothetical protein
MYFPRNWEFGSALSKLRNFGEVEPPTPFGTPLVRVIKPCPPYILSQTHSTKHLFFSSTTYTTAAYGSNPNVFIRLDSVGRPASVGSGSYATIASFHKLPLPLSRRSSSSPSPYATANIGSAIGSATYVTSTNGSGRYSHHIYSKPASTYLPSRVSYYASSQLTHLSQVTASILSLQTTDERLWT